MSHRLTEKRFLPVGPTLLTADGGTGNGANKGKLTVADTSIFKVGQVLELRSNTQSSIQVKINRIISSTEFYVGNLNKPVADRIDVSAFLLIDASFVFAHEQTRPSVPEQEIERLTYDEEPVIARRTISVDKYGHYYDEDNPIPVVIPNGTINVNVSEASEPTIQNIVALSANTEYNFTIPKGTKKYRFRVRGDARLQYAFTVGGSSTIYVTVYPGNNEEESDVNITADKIIYFMTSKANQSIEVITWK